jgi:hypothetical protein
MTMFSWFRRAPAAPTEEHLRLTRAIVGYPPYAPPEWKLDPNPEAMRAASFHYKDHFLGGAQARLEALRAFLANFEVSLSSDDAGLMAVSTWLPRWADLLVNDFDDQAVWNAYRRFEVPWTGTLSGLNVIFDLGIYYAECLWTRRTKLEWLVVRGPDGALHIIKGLPGGKGFDPIDFMYWQCRNIRKAKLPKPKWLRYSDDPFLLRSDSFCRHVLAKAPPGRRSRKSKQR